jgi:nicotinamide-nucleotide amidase
MMQLSKRIEKLIQHLSTHMMARGWMIAAAESCSGGMLAHCLTQISGSSNWFEFSVVSYSNFAKHLFLGVSQDTLDNEGAVSAPCAKQMAEGLMVKNNLLGIAITGIAGPLGGSEKCPVGTVYIAWKVPEKECIVERRCFVGERQEIAKQAVYYALRGAILNSFLMEEYQRLHYFFALTMDDDSLRKECQRLALHSGLSIEQIEPVEHFHLTLSYLRGVSEEQLRQLCDIANSMQQDTRVFDLLLTKMSYWLIPDAFVLEVEPNPILHRLAQSLQISKETFVPHLTLSKKTGPLLKPVELSVFNKTWEIGHLSLMASFHGIFYIEKKRWNLI